MSLVLFCGNYGTKTQHHNAAFVDGICKVTVGRVGMGTEQTPHPSQYTLHLMEEEVRQGILEELVLLLPGPHLFAEARRKFITASTFQEMGEGRYNVGISWKSFNRERPTVYLQTSTCHFPPLLCNVSICLAL